MKRVSDILFITAIAAAILSVIILLTEAPWTERAFAKIINNWGLIIAVILLQISLLFRLSSKNIQEVVQRNIKVMFWCSSIIIISLILLFTLMFDRISREQIIRNFHKIYYNTRPYISTYLGILSLQYPNDNWVMQEIISEVKPDFIIETGTFKGGTTLFYATILEKVNPKGKIITIDLNYHLDKAKTYETWKKFVEFIQGDSTSADIVQKIRERVKGHKVLVTLDSNHAKEHVLKELKLYSPMVSPKSYIIVQDTHLSGHPNFHYSVKGEGPWEAVQEFLKKTGSFKPDPKREKHLITQNPSGYLKRVK